MAEDKIGPEPALVAMTVTPEPTDDERDALAAALIGVLSTAPDVPDEPRRASSRWALAGRRAAIAQRVQMGWGRGNERTR